MPIKDVADAVEVESRIERIFAAAPLERAGEIRALFVEVLDFNLATGEVDIAGATGNVALPASAARIAELDGFHVLYVALDTPNTDRVRKAEVDAAARLIAGQLGDDLLLVFTNRSVSQLHLVLPSFEGTRPVLRRMVVERDLPRRTAVQQVSNIYWRRQDTGSIRVALKAAFDVEAVTKLFFERYKRVFDDALGLVQGFERGDTANERKQEAERKKLFVQTLFNRLMFVYFLSRKGWLTFQGDKDYLNALWRDYGSKPGLADSTFYRDRLKLLFFFGLNNPQSHDLNRNFRGQPMASLFGDVPFLNGGLFEETELDQRSDVIVPDETIAPILTDLFDRFNFTVMESTPFDVEVAVDPEMLGKVFEETVTARHDSGSYYTPRSVVSFMCREALKGYLAGRDTGLTPAAIAKFVDERDTSGITLSAARRISEALDEVTVVDPACGSGAYLLGMMQELVELQAALYSDRLRTTARDLYDLKLHIIQRNLYGVDNDEFAVNIAMLRLWLSLAIEYEGDTPEPLPNLDFKVVCEDSLLGPDPSPGSYPDLFRHQAARLNLGGLKAQYMSASDGNAKERLKREIAAVEAQVRQALGDAGSVDWRIRFAEVFTAHGGFDVVIANPPYVRQEEIKPASYKAALVKQYADAATRRSDLYCYFYARALQLLRDHGIHVFVCSNSWLDVGYGAKLQKYLLDNAHIHTIYESAVERQFSTADINTIISVLQKTDGSDADETRFVQLREPFEAAIAADGERREITMMRRDLRAAGMSGRKFVGDKWGGKYLRAPDIYHHIREECAGKLVRLGDMATVRRGVTTGANRFFFLTSEHIARWGIEPEFLQPVMTTPQESRSIAVNPAALPKRLFMCHQDKDALADTAALAYIQWGEAQGYHIRPSCRSRQRWYDLGKRNSALLGMNYLIDTTARTFFVGTGLYFGDNFQVLHGNAVSYLQLCAAMNSTVSQLMFNVLGRANFGGGLMKIQTFEIESLPIANPQLLPELDSGIFDSAEWDVLDPSDERQYIDQAVFDALDLTTGEREAVYAGVTELVDNRLRRARSTANGMSR